MGWREKGSPVGCPVFETSSGPHSLWFGYRRHRRGSDLRHMRTTQEIRAWDEAFGRSKRSRHRLPSYYDDIYRHVERSWKRHRATQYHVVTEM